MWSWLPEEFDQEFKPQQADVLVANILAGPLMALAPEFAKLVKSDGEFALAGVIEEQVADVSGVYSEFFDIRYRKARRKLVSHFRKTQNNKLRLFNS